MVKNGELKKDSLYVYFKAMWNPSYIWSCIMKKILSHDIEII